MGTNYPIDKSAQPCEAKPAPASGPAALVADPRPLRQAAFPFDEPTGDVIIRSCDRVEFSIDWDVLSGVSPVLKSMFTSDVPPAKRQQKPVVDLAEDENTIETLLCICCPDMDNPSFDDLSASALESTLSAAMKYKMDDAIALLTSASVLDGSKCQPKEVWTIACRLRLEELAHYAAKSWLAEVQDDGSSVFQGSDPAVRGMLRGINAGDYYRVLNYLGHEGKVSKNYRFLRASAPSRAQDGAGDPSESAAAPSYIPDMPYADLTCRSSDGVEFRVQKNLFSRGPMRLHNLINASGRPHDVPEGKGSMSSGNDDLAEVGEVVQLDEKAVVLAKLVAFYTIGADGDIPSHDAYALADVMAAAHKYRLKSLYDAARPSWTPLAKASPLRAFFAATRTSLRLPDCAQEAASFVIKEEFGLAYTYIPDLEWTPAQAYHRLLRYVSACAAAVQTAFDPGFPRMSEDVPANAVDRRGKKNYQFRKWHEDFEHWVTAITLCDSIDRMDAEETDAPWLSTIASARDQAKACPGLACRSWYDAFTKVTNDKGWCKGCRPIADDFVKLADVLTSASTRVDMVNVWG
ncbi:hypothetical protein C2E23DRAFT_881810 [Lenzites betulinus]|nr:hypothetical protein C2E23DRAFT_881810 [Lenzites betulinus]